MLSGMPLIRLRSALLILAPLGAAPALAQGPPPGTAAPVEAAAPAQQVAARATGLVAEEGGLLAGDAGVVTVAQLDEVLLWRSAMAPEGQAALQQLLEVRVVDRLGEEGGVEITNQEIADRYRELDRQIRASGQASSLAEVIETEGIPRARFREYLRLSMVQEILARRALGIDAAAPVTSEEQTTWLKGAIAARGTELMPHPWAEGRVATCGEGVTITRDEFLEHLRGELPRDEVGDACYMILLERAVRARMPDLSEAGIESALDREIERRRAEIAADPKYRGADYEQVLGAKGLSIEAVRRDPAIRAAALAHEAVNRDHDDEGLRAAYEKERLFFDAAFGEAVEIYWIFKYAGEGHAMFPDFDIVEADLRTMRDKIEGPEEFRRAVPLQSQDTASKQRDGFLGSLSRVGKSGELDTLRKAAFETLDGAGSPEEAEGAIFGPVRTNNGVGLGMLGKHRRAPTWERMKELVHTHLRREFLAGCLAATNVDVLLYTSRNKGAQGAPAEASADPRDGGK